MNSDDDLTEIFKLIESSENLVEEKKRLLGDLQKNSDACIEEISTLKELNRESLKKLEDSERELASLEQNFKFLDRQCIHLEEQRQLLNEEINSSKKNLKQTEKIIEEERQNFNKKAADFLSRHDISGKKEAKRRIELKEKLRTALSQIDDLKCEISQLERDNRESLENQSKIEELNRIYAEKLNETQELERKKAEISNLLDNDPEYKRMNEELKFYRKQNLKVQCQELSQELNFLQDRYNLLCPSSVSFEMKMKKGLGRKRHLGN